MEQRLKKYCDKNNTTMLKLAYYTDVSLPQLYIINSGKTYPTKITTLEKIYQGTKKHLGRGLRPSEYLDFECLK